VMGGNITVASTVGKGSSFRVKMILSEVTNPRRIAPIEAPIFGYHGPRKTILVTDDDPSHRDLLREVLGPLGFILLSAPDGAACLELAEHCRPDLFLLDVSMPGLSGWAVAETLRERGHDRAKMLMVSASAPEAHAAPLAQTYHDGFLMKPIDIPRLLERIGHLLRIEWQHVAVQVEKPVWVPTAEAEPPAAYVEALTGLGRLGQVRAIQLKLDQLASEHPQHSAFALRMRAIIDRFDLNGFMSALKVLQTDER